ncbi:MAG TPA: hypothetical protein VH637_15680 [Streptosporangiaceae bacterium]|jgi:hypothetical protein
MARVTWRQHRGALITLVAASAALALATVTGGLRVQGRYARYAADGCVARPIHVPCGTIANTLAAGTTSLDALVIALHVLPVLVGVFIGAPLVARELESGTFRFTWTQGIGRTRFVVTTSALLAAVAAVTTCALGALFSWYAHPFEAVGLASRFQPGFFDTTVATFPAWTLFALSTGTFLGALIGRLVSAMAVTAAAAGGLLVAAFWELDHHLLSLGALVTRVRPTGGQVLSLGLLNAPGQDGLGPAGSWLVRGWITGPGGHQLSDTAASSLQDRMIAATANAGSKDPATWMSLHHYAYWLSYQPADRFWYFQAITGAALAVLAAASMLATVRLVRSRG